MKNHICQKVSPVLKFLNKNLSDGTLKLGKIKLEVFLDSKSKKNSNSKRKSYPAPPSHDLPPPPPPPGGGGGRGGEGGVGQNLFLEFDTFFFFYFEFKNTSNLIFPSFKGPSERFLFKDFKTGPTFLANVIFQFSKFSPKVFPYRWDTLYNKSNKKLTLCGHAIS